MKRNLQALVVPASIAASFLIGCSSPSEDETKQTAGYPVAGHWVEVPRSHGDETKQPVTYPVTQPEPAPTPAPAPTPEVLKRHESVLLSYTGTITDIDYPNREMTLKDSEGRYETFYVDKKVQRFNEAKVGDKVSMDYYLAVDAEIRKPTAEEEQNPLVVVQTAGRAGPDAAPAAHDRRQIRAVVTIEAMDRAAQTVTVKGPRGKYFTARVVDPSRYEKVRIGDTILMTFTESTAISLKPAN